QVFRDEHRATTHAAIAAVLTEDQQATFKSLRDERGPHHPGMQGMGHGMKHGMGQGMDHRMGQGMNDHMGPGMMDGGRRHHMGRMSMRDSDSDWLGGPMMRGLARKLDLTDKQHQELATIRKDQKAKLNAWNESHPDATWQDRLTFRRDGFDASIAAIGNILTPEQNAKLNELSAKRGKMEFGRRGWDQGPGMFMRRLDLTKDQQDQLETLHEQHRAAAKAWHEANPNATPEQRRAFREAQRKGMEASLGNVLTEEQMAKFKSMRDHHRGGPAWDNPDDAGDEPGEN
ncbi:MAG: hypothetical protein WBW88_00955, partial [Rhodothermales bacterium]